MDHDFLLGVLAVQLGFATPAQVMAAASAWLADRSQSIAERLTSTGALAPPKRALLETVLGEALKLHGGDAHKTLHTLGGDQALFRSFGGSLVLDGQGRVAPAPGAEPGQDAAAQPPEQAPVSVEQPGKYRLRGGAVEKAEIGRGGLGRVLVAFDEHVGREVAIKELLDAGTGSTEAPTGEQLLRTSAVVARFLREARVTGQLEHPNIVPVYEVGQRPDGTFYYAMRVVRGRTLAARLEDAGSLGERLKLLPHYVNLCNAIAYAHSRNVVHRDIKPENVMIGEFGETVVLDWGLAKLRGQKDIRSRELAREVKLLQDAGAGQTVDGSAVGTPAYMSPEQAEGRIEEIDERSDVWGLGAVLYQLLTGHPPFEGITPFEILGKVLKDPVEPVRSSAADVPAELAAVAEKALRRERGARYPTAKELAGEIDSFLQGRRVGAYSYSSWDLVRRFVARNKVLSFGSLALLLVLLASSILVFAAWGREQQARAAATEARAAAEARERDAKRNLAQAYVSRAEQLGREHDFGSGFVYAAAALREIQRTGLELASSERVALESALYEAKVRRSLTLERSWPGVDGALQGMVLSHDGRLVAAFDDRQQLRLQRLDGAAPAVSRVLAGAAVMLWFTPDDQELLVSYNDGTLRRHDLGDLRETQRELVRAGHNNVVALSRDLRLALVVDVGSQLVLLARRGSTEAPVTIGPALSAVLLPDGSRVVRCAADSAIAVHDAADGRPLDTIAVGDKVAHCVLARDGKRLLALTAAGPVEVDLARQSVVGRLKSGSAVATSWAADLPTAGSTSSRQARSLSSESSPRASRGRRPCGLLTTRACSWRPTSTAPCRRGTERACGSFVPGSAPGVSSRIWPRRSTARRS